MSDAMKKGLISFVGDKPMQLTENANDDTPALTPEQHHTVSAMGKVIREYREAAKNLLAEKYSHLRESAPEYLADPGNIMVVCCTDGVVIRYERKLESSRIFSGWMSEDLPQVVAMLSQNLIQCYTSQQFTSTVDKTGTEIKLSAVNPDTSQAKELLSIRIGFAVVIDRPEHIPAPPRKPYCLCSVQNTLVLSQLGFGNCLRKRLRLLPFFRSVDVGGWQPWDENGMWSGWKGKNETSWND